MSTALQIARLVAVMALVCVAAAIATPRGRLPLALRGLAKMLRSCEVPRFRGSEVKQPRNPVTPQPRNPETQQPSAWKRGLAFLLVILAILLALI